jgi:thioredoxin 2
MASILSICHHCHSFNRLERERALKNEALCGKCHLSLNLHGLVTEVNTVDFWRLIHKSDMPVIVDFWASWCGPCQVYGPEFQKASVEVSQAVFLKVNTETESILSQQLGIRGIPCTIVFKGGREVKRQSGVMNTHQIKDLL